MSPYRVEIAARSSCPLRCARRHTSLQRGDYVTLKQVRPRRKRDGIGYRALERGRRGSYEDECLGYRREIRARVQGGDEGFYGRYRHREIGIRGKEIMIGRYDASEKQLASIIRAWNRKRSMKRFYPEKKTWGFHVLERLLFPVDHGRIASSIRTGR
jgi:hypothetical protein